MSKIFGYLGLCRRANKLSYGETAMNDILTNHCCLCLIASDASSNTKKKFIDKCNSHNVPYAIVVDSKELSYAIGKCNIKCFSINDANFAKMIKEALK